MPKSSWKKCINDTSKTLKKDGISYFRHDKKSDKGTQSPMLKIFKDIMMRENNDSEKRNLLPNRQEQSDDKKRRQYNTSRTKIDRRSNGSISSEHRKRSPYKGNASEQRGNIQDSQYTQLQTENKDSWLSWQKLRNRKPVQPEGDDETCSCASCALRRLVGSEYAYIFCLLLIFVVSIIGACLLVFKSIPSVVTQSAEKSDVFDIDDSRVDSERLKRKIDVLNEDREKNELSEGVFGKLQYDDIFRQDPGNLQVSSNIDFGPSFRELNAIDDGDSKSEDDMELANFIEPEKLDVQGNEKLREFYKKLVQTDAKIKNLKKATTSDMNFNNNYETKSPEERFRRSLKLYNYPKRYHVRRRRGLYDKDKQKKVLRRSNRLKKSIEAPTGFVLEKKKIIIQYQPEAKRKVPKCSHTPKESNQHENELKHPFYQNSQRLDELLDRFFNKNLPEIMSDPFGFDMIFEQHKNKCKHPNLNKNSSIDIDQKHPLEKDKIKEENVKTSEVLDDNKTFVKEKDLKLTNNNQIPKPFINLMETDHTPYAVYTPKEIKKLLASESTTDYQQKFYNDEANMIAKEKHNIMTASTTEFQVMLSVSTLMNQFATSGNLVTGIPLIDRVPQIRRLMQADEEEENLGYEDFKEVLTDDMENQDDVDRRADRKKRNDALVKDSKFQEECLHQDVSVDTPPKIVKFNPPGVHNPNWKGPMPLYPDELNSMIQHAADKYAKVPPVNNLDLEPKSEARKKKQTSDLDYIEDYLDNRYDKLVEMAQAYSDYGVLEGKTGYPRNEKNQATDNISPGPRIKLSAVGNIFSRGLLGRIKEAGTTTVNFSAKRNLNNLVNEQAAASSKIPYNMDQSSEGIRIEIRPTAETRDDNLQMAKVIQSHIKINPEIEEISTERSHTEIMYNPKITYENVQKHLYSKNIFEHSHKTVRPTESEDDMSNGLIFAIHKGRALLSTQAKKYDDSLIGVFDYNNKDSDKITSTATQDYANANEDEKIILEILNQLNSQQLTTVLQKNENNDNQMSPDLTDIVLEEYSTQNYSHMSQSPKKVMQFINTPIYYKPMVVKTISPPNIDNSGTMLFKSNSKSDKSTHSINEKNNFKPHKSLVKSSKMTFKLFGNSKLERDNDVALIKPIDFNNMDLQHGSLQFSDYENKIDKRFTGKNVGLVKYNGIDMINSLGYKKHFNNKMKRYTVDPQEITERRNGTVTLRKSNMATRATVSMNKTANVAIKCNDNVIVASKNNEGNNSMISEFFRMVSSWFPALKGAKVDTKVTHITEPDFINRVIRRVNDSYNSEADNMSIVTKQKDNDANSNIIHKSRCLMSVSDVNATDSVKISGSDDIDAASAKDIKVTSEDPNKTSATILAATIRANKTTTHSKTAHTKVPKLRKILKKRSNKVKRNADNSNLIFWNDIYDDEYGVQTDSLDNINIGDKYSRNRNDFIKRSGRWVQEKFRKIAENLKGHDQELVTRKRMPRETIEKIGLGQYPKYIFNKIFKRDSVLQNKYESDNKAMFSALGANLMLVCKKAANAVKQVKNIEVKEDTKQGSIATTLMQQLVSLLTEIVDYQVEQKTCTKLPPDLQSYLEWLTLPENESKNVKVQQSEAPILKFTQTYPKTTFEVTEENKSSETNTILETSLPYYKDDQQKTSYLDTLKSVEDLMEEYKMMNDEDKSKMTGVKYYLENQLNLLKTGIGSSLYDVSNNNNLFFRYKRNHLPKRQRRRKRKLNKFIRNFGKKHTRTTAGYYDGAAITEMKKVQNERLENLEMNGPKKIQDAISKGIKRNLKDVYYHALAEAKKYTKVGLKTGNTADFSTTQSIKLHGYNHDVRRVVKEKPNRVGR